ncbi:MAG: DMT family transporter [Verrucomicrobia bacterium]|nr:DMT family transporter [Verrucomicrobiota bacterium]MBU6446572.1 DMT family transporter [Verrucomicrobiota bacterium]MDE3047291.1 DMT family transporter [Verrucomicrobiota bacterium]
MHQSEHTGFWFALLAVFFTAGMSLFVKLSSSATVATLVFSRFILGVPLFVPMARAKKIHLSWQGVPKNLMRSLAGLGSLYTFYYALHTLPLVNAITLASTAPLFLPILNLIWKKKLVSKQRWWAAGIGFLGVVVMLRPSTTEFLVIGSLFALLTGLFRAVAIFNVRSLAKTEAAETILAYYFCIGAVLSFFPLVVDFQWIRSPEQWLYVFLAGIMSLGYQYTLTRACAHLATTKVSSINYLSVVAGGLLGWWVFHEIPDMWVWAGTALIIVGALLALLDRHRTVQL